MYLHVLDCENVEKDQTKKETKTSLKVICFHQGVVKGEFIIVGDGKNHMNIFLSFAIPQPNNVHAFVVNIINMLTSPHT